VLEPAPMHDRLALEHVTLAEHLKAQGVALAVTLAAALISLVVGALVDGCALTLLFSVPSLIFLVLLKGLLFVAM